MTRRADRLFQIVQILRGRRLTTAALLAERLGVSERTVYRDIRDLSLSGVPVEGEAGSGYRLLAGYDLPPLMLTTKESEAMIAAIRLLKTGAVRRCRSRWSPPRKCWRSCRRRVGAAEQTRLFAPDLGAHRYAKTHFDVIHRAVSNQQVLQLHYQDESGQVTWREVLPWGCFSGANAGCWWPGANCAMITAIFASTVVWRSEGPNVDSASAPTAR